MEDPAAAWRLVSAVCWASCACFRLRASRTSSLAARDDTPQE